MNIWKVAYHPDRLTTPLIRKNGKLEPASWEEALSLIETKFKEFHKKYGYDSVVLFVSTGACLTGSCTASFFLQPNVIPAVIRNGKAQCMDLTV